MVTFLLDSLPPFTPTSNSTIPGLHRPLKTAWEQSNPLTLY